MARIVDATEIVNELGQSKATIRGMIASLEIGKAAMFDAGKNYDSVSSCAYTIGRIQSKKFSVRKTSNGGFAVIRKS